VMFAYIRTASPGPTNIWWSKILPHSPGNLTVGVTVNVTDLIFAYSRLRFQSDLPMRSGDNILYLE
jgi:hypothetical protein